MKIRVISNIIQLVINKSPVDRHLWSAEFLYCAAPYNEGNVIYNEEIFDFSIGVSYSDCGFSGILAMGNAKHRSGFCTT